MSGLSGGTSPEERDGSGVNATKVCWLSHQNSLETISSVRLKCKDLKVKKVEKKSQNCNDNSKNMEDQRNPVIWSIIQSIQVSI